MHQIKSKQILEAVRKGIKLALDDYQDIEPNSSISNDVIDAEDVIQNRIDLSKYVIDLGLPSGTRWCKYNLGVNSNKLSKVKDWYGNYYAWGETQPKETYSWDTYEHGYGSYSLYKYVNNPDKAADDNDNKTDGYTILLPEDDAATKNIHLHNFKFCMPTKEQCEELLKYTKSYWVNNYNPNNTVHHTNDDGINGLNGRVFIGQNGNCLFVPAAGYRYNSNIGNIGSSCYLWSSSLYLSNSANAYYLYIDLDDIKVGCNLRYDGYNVRPVIKI